MIVIIIYQIGKSEKNVDSYLYKHYILRHVNILSKSMNSIVLPPVGRTI